MNERRTTAPGAAGFTILELTVVIGLLGVFMMFLLQIVLVSTDVFQEGQAGQERAAKTLAAVRPIEACLRDMIGPSQDDKRQASDARLLVQWFPIGLERENPVGSVQVLRSTVRLPKYLERELLEARFREMAAATIGNDSQQEIDATVTTLIRRTGFKGRGEMLLIPWPAGDAEGAFFDLRRGVFLPGAALPFREAELASLLEIRELGDPRFPAKHIEPHTTVIATGLLHLAYRLASQYTRNRTAGPSAKGPEYVWDSARAGWLLQGAGEHDRFTLDLGPVSGQDSTDDVYPRYVEVTVVVGRGPDELPEGLLSTDISATERTIRLINTDRLPADIHDNFLKVGSEWVQFAARSGATLNGVKRGMRGTAARAHERRTGVRAGKTDVMSIKILHARDSWNG